MNHFIKRIPRVYLIGVLGAALGVIAMMFTITRGHSLDFDPGLEIVTDGVAGFLFLGCGAFAHARRPDNRVGLLMVLLGLARFAEDIQLSITPWVHLVGLLFTMASVSSAVHLALAFPTGELATPSQRILVRVGYAISLGIFPVIQILLEIPFGINDDLGRRDLGIVIVRMVRIGLVIAVFAVLLNRWRTATPPVRRLLTPMLVVAIAGGASELVVNTPLSLRGASVGLAANLVGRVAVALFPVVFLIGVLRVRMGRTAVADMLTQLGEATSATDLQALLARTLRDPSLQIGYWRGDGPMWVDADGAALAVPDDGQRAVTMVTWNGRDVAALLHDAAISENRHVLEAATTAVGLALEHQRLTSEIRARLAEVRAARARIVEVADAERHRVERDLHDGAQQRLVTAALTFQMASERLAADIDPAVAALLKTGTDNLQNALRELRELARGIHPAVLTEAGLIIALEALAERAPLPVVIIADPLPPLPPIVEATAYFVAAEALTNAVKHAGHRHRQTQGGWTSERHATGGAGRGRGVLPRGDRPAARRRGAGSHRAGP
ncbi:MAG: histidine kinase [Actinobacteria bacterium]|nr:histidine kinase [Actinomycetota bacterium]